jgi:hypothetical protein
VIYLCDDDDEPTCLQGQEDQVTIIMTKLPTKRNSIPKIGYHYFWPGLTALLKNTLPIENKGGVSHYGLAIYIKKYLKAKEELWKLKYFTMQKIYNLQKNPCKRNQNPSRYYNYLTNFQFQHKPKYHLSKILI